MVAFVGVEGVKQLVAHTGVEKFLTDLIGYVEEDFRKWERFDKNPRVASHTPFGVIELMPTSDYELYAFKYVNGHPSNPLRGFQTVSAFGALAAVHNGYPLMLAEMTLLTAFRTAATSAMVARYLARTDSKTLALIGAGSQSEFQAIAMRITTGVNTIQLYDIDPDAMAKAARHLTAFGFDVILATSTADAVRGADIVTTCTADKTYATILTDDMIEPGMHLNAIGGDCPGKTELDPAILHRGEVFVEFPPQTRIEGEIQHQAPDFPITELWRVITGATPGRSSADQITIFDSVGFAIEDFSVLRYVYDITLGTDIPDRIDLVADPDDPKDLFGLLPMPVPVG